MDLQTLFVVGAVSLGIGTISGYYARQLILKKRAGTLESKLEAKVKKSKKKANSILEDAKEKAEKIVEKAEKEKDKKKKEIAKADRLLLKREEKLDNKISKLEQKEERFEEKVNQLKGVKKRINDLEQEAQEKLEEISGLSEEEAKEKLLNRVEQKHQKEVLAKIRKLEKKGWKKYEKKAKKILATAIQKCAVPQTQEITTTTVSLPDDEIKGRIIGKEGRNINTLEKLTGVEIVVDDTPEVVVISGFNPIRRQVAKTALKELIKDGRIQPSRIEEKVEDAEEEIEEQIKKAGEAAAYKVGVIDLDSKLVKLLGRLHFRTSFGQNVLLHSIETAFLTQGLAEEIGANPQVAKKAGFLHDIGKAVDHQVEGSHVEIGMKILEKFDIDPEVIKAMKSHHEDYAPENLEAVLVQCADAISGARPGARKENLDDYLKRLKDLEDLALSFSGVKKAWALHAGREVRVFVRPGEVNDVQSQEIARGIASRIEDEMNYPGEIKVNVIRENRVTEYAK